MIRRRRFFLALPLPLPFTLASCRLWGNQVSGQVLGNLNKPTNDSSPRNRCPLKPETWYRYLPSFNRSYESEIGFVPDDCFDSEKSKLGFPEWFFTLTD